MNPCLSAPRRKFLKPIEASTEWTIPHKAIVMISQNIFLQLQKCHCEEWRSPTKQSSNKKVFVKQEIASSQQTLLAMTYRFYSAPKAGNSIVSVPALTT